MNLVGISEVKAPFSHFPEMVIEELPPDGLALLFFFSADLYHSAIDKSK